MDLIPVRMLTQYTYCPRLGYMEWVQKEFEVSSDVAEGTYQHRNVDVVSGTKKMAEKDAETIHARSVYLSDENLGLIAKTDLIEIKGEKATPVEYKKGRVPDIPGGVYDSTLVQVCAQGLLLRAHGYESNGGVVYYVASKRRVHVPFDDVAIAKTLQHVHDMKEMIKNNAIPPPLVNSPKCPRCSLVGICMPDEVNILSKRIPADSVRRMYPIRVDTVPVYVQEQGAYVSQSGETLVVKTKNGAKRNIRLIDVSDVTLYGNIQITTQAVRTLCDRGIPVCYLSYGGRFIGITDGQYSKNVDLRIRQFRAYEDKAASLKIAKSVVRGKIKNSMVLLRRNHKSTPTVLGELATLADRCVNCRDYNVLLGIEGLAAKLYFSDFNGMLKKDTEFNFKNRNRRPPRDPINAMLSWLYMMLVRQMSISIRRVGLDLYLGYLHTPHHGRPALALDMMEEFRSIVCDSVCINMVNTEAIKESDFVTTPFGVNMTDGGRRRVIKSFESRMDATIRHPLLKYSVSYRRILEVQARLLARYLQGEIPEYIPFRTR